MLKQSQTSLGETSITALTTMDDASPSVLHADRAHRDHPSRGSTGRHAHTGETLGVCQRRLMPRASATLLSREQGLDPQSLRLHAPGLCSGSPRAHHRARRFLPCCPPTDAHTRTIIFPCKAPGRSRAHGPRLTTRPHGVKAQGLAVPRRRQQEQVSLELMPTLLLSQVM